VCGKSAKVLLTSERATKSELSVAIGNLFYSSTLMLTSYLNSWEEVVNVKEVVLSQIRDLGMTMR
jgi:hypothetical protein